MYWKKIKNWRVYEIGEYLYLKSKRWVVAKLTLTLTLKDFHGCECAKCLSLFCDSRLQQPLLLKYYVFLTASTLTASQDVRIHTTISHCFTLFLSFSRDWKSSCILWLFVLVCFTRLFITSTGLTFYIALNPFNKALKTMTFDEFYHK